MKFALDRFSILGADPGDPAGTWVEVGDPYVDVVYGPVAGPVGLLMLRYLHATLEVRETPWCSSGELAQATGTNPRRVGASLRRLERWGLLVVDAEWRQPPGLEAASGSITLTTEVPVAPIAVIELLHPVAVTYVRTWEER